MTIQIKLENNHNLLLNFYNFKHACNAPFIITRMLTRGRKRKLIDDSVHPALSKRSVVLEKILHYAVGSNDCSGLGCEIMVATREYSQKDKVSKNERNSAPLLVELIHFRWICYFANIRDHNFTTRVQMTLMMRRETPTYNGSKSTHKFALLGGIQLPLRSFSEGMIFISIQTDRLIEIL